MKTPTGMGGETCISLGSTPHPTSHHQDHYHQAFQVSKMEGFLNLIRLFWGWVFPYISRIHTAYIGEDSSILPEMFGDITFITLVVRNPELNPSFATVSRLGR